MPMKDAWVNAAYESTSGKMIKLLVSEKGKTKTDGETPTYLWIHKDKVPVPMDELKGLLIVNLQTKEIEPKEAGEKPLLRLIAGDFKTKEGVKFSVTPSARTTGGGGNGYIAINHVEEKEKSFKVLGKAIKGQDRTDVNFFMQKTAVSPEIVDKLKECIILGAQIEQITKNNVSYNVLKSGTIRDKEKNTFAFEAKKTEAAETPKRTTAKAPTRKAS